MIDMHALRRQYGALSLDETLMADSPIEQCERWLEEAITTEPTDPTAVVLSTVDEQGMPDARVVLIKAIESAGFVFYTHYLSAKGRQLATKPACALTCYWPTLARQIRIKGHAVQLDATASDAYFSSRPYLSQLAAVVSPQSQVISNRQVLEEDIEQLKKSMPVGQVVRPSEWGGYLIHPDEVEFWQGRDNRLHDRVVYTQKGEAWAKTRLAP